MERNECKRVRGYDYPPGCKCVRWLHEPLGGLVVVITEDEGGRIEGRGWWLLDEDEARPKKTYGHMPRMELPSLGKLKTFGVEGGAGHWGAVR